MTQNPVVIRLKIENFVQSIAYSTISLNEATQQVSMNL